MNTALSYYVNHHTEIRHYHETLCFWQFFYLYKRWPLRQLTTDHKELC